MIEMYLFSGFHGNFEAVKFPEENLIFVALDGWVFYFYDCKEKRWHKIDRGRHNLHITVKNYQEISKEEIMDAMNGVFPEKETDIMKLCNPKDLNDFDMPRLLREEYEKYMSDEIIDYAVERFLSTSESIRTRAFLALKKIFDNALTNQRSNEQVLAQIKEQYFAFWGKEIFRAEIEIIDGNEGSSYFWIMPVRVIDYTDTNDFDNVARMEHAEISIEHDDVSQYLEPFLLKHFDSELEANKKRLDMYDNKPLDGFEWYVTDNFYTHDSVKNLIRDLEDTIDALSTGRENEFTIKLREKRGSETFKLLYSKTQSQEEIDEYNNNRPTVDDTAPELIVDFYRRLIFRLEYMMNVGIENGYNLISVMGP